ncbi:hypothetical protein ACOQFL_19515 [Actinopolyspora sp. H202]|uniref:Uncharacterized protein n=1 Tax=Actinopolyspora mzabensis TaxID=995066 RepID=A0A1G9CPK4_ACTMZ|nr:hypothetical protein [Actinopolyspora mzabensis]SDK53621.1 hypothetical protein SAMN04487820_10928 [Actinopolyspora mzabensis]
MANTAHFITATEDDNPVLTVRDDRGAEVTELELPPTVSEPTEADDELLAAGWSRSADWTTADDGYVAPVVPA